LARPGSVYELGKTQHGPCFEGHRKKSGCTVHDVLGVAYRVGKTDACSWVEDPTTSGHEEFALLEVSAYAVALSEIAEFEQRQAYEVVQDGVPAQGHAFLEHIGQAIQMAANAR